MEGLQLPWLHTSENFHTHTHSLGLSYKQQHNQVPSKLQA